MYGTLSGRYDDGPKNGVSFNIFSILIRRNFSDPMPASTLPPSLFPANALPLVGSRGAVVSAALSERKVAGSIPTIGDFHTVGPCKKAVFACLATDVK